MEHATAKPPDCTGVILAGGLNSRMGGRNKAFLEIGGRLILDRLQSTLAEIFDDILLVTRQPELYAGRNLRVVTDIYDIRSSLTGIHAGLAYAATDHVFVVPCDAPFVKPELIRLLLSHLRPDLDVVVPEHEGYYEPLCAIYAKGCLPFITAQLERRELKIFKFFKEIRLKAITRQEIVRVDPELISFRNINTPEALAQCLALVQVSDSPSSFPT